MNQVKRKSLKSIIGAAAGATVMSQIPLSAVAGVIQPDQSGLSITHVETVFGHTVFIENMTDHAVKLESLTPGTVSTSTGEFDINSLLVDGGLKIKPATTQAHNISSDGRVHNWAVWDTLESSNQPMMTSGRSRPVNVLLHDHSLASPPKALVHLGQFS